MPVKKAPKSSVKQTFCAGCGHGIISRLLNEVIEENGYENNTCMVIGVGCSCNLIGGLCPGDFIHCAHGRASATATGIKRVRPGILTISYQGDGDAGVIGLAETLNAAYRNENITLILVNNSNYGMTGGQMSWTTMPGQITTTSQTGRDCGKTGFPFHMPELIAREFNVAYAARGSVHDVKHINQAKKMIDKAIKAQIEGKGYSIVEILAPCPTNWHMSPLKSLDFIENNMLKEYPVGEFETKGSKA